MIDTKIGQKFDQEKDRWDLLPIECIEDTVKILTFGAKKYGANNWQIVENAKDRYYAALMRHIISWRKGELIDPESGISHLAHAMCNMIFLQWFDKQIDIIEKIKPFYDSIKRSWINISDEQIEWMKKEDEKMMFGKENKYEESN